MNAPMPSYDESSYSMSRMNRMSRHKKKYTMFHDIDNCTCNTPAHSREPKHNKYTCFKSGEKFCPEGHVCVSDELTHISNMSRMCRSDYEGPLKKEIKKQQIADNTSMRAKAKFLRLMRMLGR